MDQVMAIKLADHSKMVASPSLHPVLVPRPYCGVWNARWCPQNVLPFFCEMEATQRSWPKLRVCQATVFTFFFLKSYQESDTRWRQGLPAVSLKNWRFVNNMTPSRDVDNDNEKSSAPGAMASGSCFTKEGLPPNSKDPWPNFLHVSLADSLNVLSTIRVILQVNLGIWFVLTKVAKLVGNWGCPVSPIKLDLFFQIDELEKHNPPPVSLDHRLPWPRKSITNESGEASLQLDKLMMELDLRSLDFQKGGDAMTSSYVLLWVHQSGLMEKPCAKSRKVLQMFVPSRSEAGRHPPSRAWAIFWSLAFQAGVQGARTADPGAQRSSSDVMLGLGLGCLGWFDASPSKASPWTGWRMILSNWAKCSPLRSKSSSCVSWNCSLLQFRTGPFLNHFESLVACFALRKSPGNLWFWRRAALTSWISKMLGDGSADCLTKCCGW